jgi:hypothetical protein
MSQLYGKLVRLRPIVTLRWAVLLMLIPALVFAVSSTATQFESSKKCQGAFSRAFNDGFDRYRCDLAIRHVGARFEIVIPLP